MDRSRLSLLAFDVLRKNPQTHVHAVENEIRQIADDYDRHDVLTLHEILWDLLVQGILAPGKNSLNLNLPFVHVTEHGAACLEDGRIQAYDPDGYIGRLSRHAGTEIDSTILEDVREALLCFLAGLFGASMTMLGRAVETLYDRIFSALGPANADAWTAVRSYEALVDALGDAGLPAEIEEPSRIVLSDLHSILRTIRSNSGTPRMIHVDRDAVLARLLLFPDQCRVAYDLVARIRERSNPS